MSNFAYLRPLLIDLGKSDASRKLAFELIDVYFKRASTLADYDLLGEMSMKVDYHNRYLECAIAAYTMCTTTEQLISARENMIKAYSALNYPEQALFYIEEALKITPDNAELKLQQAFNYGLLGDNVRMENIVEELINAKRVKESEYRFILSARYLRQGQTGQGVLNFIDAFKPRHNELFDGHLKMVKWTGQQLPAGSKIYVQGEGGIGDEIICIRFFDHMQRLGYQPILYAPTDRPDLVALFRSHGHHVVQDVYSIDRSAHWTYMLALPGYLGVTEKDLWTGPYLVPKRDPKNILPPTAKLRVGIKKSGNPYFAQDTYRRIDLDEMVAAIPAEYEVFYIDKEEISHPRVTNLAPMIETWDDTLDLIDQMDIILSSCTSLVHAAGAIGKKTIVIVPIAKYFIWTTSRTDGSSPWYGDNFTVLYQDEVRNWNTPLKQSTTLLNQHSALVGRATPAVKVS